MKWTIALIIIIAVIVVGGIGRAQQGVPPPVLPQQPDTSVQKQPELLFGGFPPEFTSVEPQGKGGINQDFLANYPPTRIPLPRYVGLPPEIDEKTATQVATERAKWEWGESIRLGTVIPLIGADGSIWAYDVDFTVDGSTFGDYVKVASDWQEFCRTRVVNQESLSLDKGTEPSIMRELGSKKYGSITLSATYDAPPIIGSRAGVSNFYASGWVAFKIAQDVLYTDKPVLKAVFFYGPWERAYEFEAGFSTVVIEGQEPWFWYDGSEFRKTSITALLQRKEYIFKLIKDAGLDTSSFVDSVRNVNRMKLRNWLNRGIPKRSPQSDHYIPGYNTSFKPFYWHGGCSPTSGAMVLNYYDEITWYGISWHGKLNYWFQSRNCPVYGDEQCHVASLIPSMISYMHTNSSGITLAWDIYPGMVNYANDCGYCFDGGTNATCSILGWCWDEIVAEINGGYPFAWSLSWYPGAGGAAHTVAAVGYEDVNQDVWCYNTWATGNVLEKVHHSGAFYQLSFVAAPHPGCGVQYDAKLTSLDGYQTYAQCGYSGSVTGGQTAAITWNNFSHPGHHVNIYYSTNGGNNWIGIVTTDDDGSYTWNVPCGVASTKGRILIQQYSTASNFVSSDGSYGDFRIIEGSAPDAPSWCSASDNNCNYIVVNWQNVSGEDGYKVYRDGSQIGTTGADVTSYQDNITGTHSYKVKAYHNTCGESGYSPSDNGTGLTAPSAPSTCTASDNNCNYILVNWQNVSGEDGYKVYRDGSQIGTTGADVTSYQDNITGTHSYKVKAYHNTCGESGYSPSDNGKGWAIPSVPTNVISTAHSGWLQICWTDVSDEAGYKIYRDDSYLDSVDVNINCYDDMNPLIGRHHYAISAFNKCGDSPKSTPIYDSLYFVEGNVTDDWGNPWVNAMVFVIDRLGKAISGSSSIVDTASTNSQGDYQFVLPAGLCSVFRDSLVHRYTFLLPEDAANDSVLGLNFRSFSDIEELSEEKSKFTYSLSQNYPNPFNPETIIEYSIRERGHVTLTIYNVLGQEVRTSVSQEVGKGNHRITWDGMDSNGVELANGIYFYRLTTQGFSMNKKMILLK